MLLAALKICYWALGIENMFLASLKTKYVISSIEDMTRNQINDTFLFQNRVKVKVVGEVSEK